MVHQNYIAGLEKINPFHNLTRVNPSSSEPGNLSSLSPGEGAQVQIHVGKQAVFVTHKRTILSREPRSILARDVKIQTQQYNPHPLLRYTDRDDATFMHIISYLRTGHPDFHKLDMRGLDQLEKESCYFELWGLKERTNMERERRKKSISNQPTILVARRENSLVEEPCQEEMWVDDALLRFRQNTSGDRLPVPDDDLVFEMAL